MHDGIVKTAKVSGNIPPVPFQNGMKRRIHFIRHGDEFDATTPEQYEQMADKFMLGPMNADTRECVRSGGNLRNRMDFATVHFGVAQIRRPVICTFTFHGPTR